MKNFLDIEIKDLDYENFRVDILKIFFVEVKNFGIDQISVLIENKVLVKENFRIP